jgi:curved DNA-binding protein
MKDYYQTLGVDKGASADDIKKAYRSLASKHHPDKGGNTATFQEIQEAYATLGDPEKKSGYDNPQPQGRSFSPGEFEAMFGGGHPFANFFGFNQHNPFGHQQPRQNRNIQLQTRITLEEAFYGKEILTEITLPSGRTPTLNINIPKGIHHGQTLRLSGVGDDTIPNMPRGDIMLQIQILEHPTYTRQGDDLVQEISISCIDAMLGKLINISSIDNKLLETMVPAGTQNNSVLSLQNYGMPNMNIPTQRGRILVKINLVVPKLTAEQQDALRSLELQ